MKIRLSTLKHLINETLLAENIPVYSTLNLKPGTILRYTGPDMEKPAMVKVISTNGDIVTLCDKHGRVHKISEKDLHTGEYTPVN